jgi:hypothetical protein
MGFILWNEITAFKSAGTSPIPHTEPALEVCSHVEKLMVSLNSCGLDTLCL